MVICIRGMLRVLKKQEVKLMANNQLSKYECDLLFIMKICPDCGEAAFDDGLENGCVARVTCKSCGSLIRVLPPLFAERIGGANGAA